MNQRLQKYINRSVELLAEKQMELGLLAEDRRATFVKDFMREVSRFDLSDGLRHLQVAFQVVDAEAQIRRVSPKEAAALFLATYEQSCRRDRAALTPAVPIEQSVQSDHIVCLEDGKQVKLLKRYLRTYYGMSPDQYRGRWGLPRSYPMTPGISADIRKRLLGDTLGGSRSS